MNKVCSPELLEGKVTSGRVAYVRASEVENEVLDLIRLRALDRNPSHSLTRTVSTSQVEFVDTLGLKLPVVIINHDKYWTDPQGGQQTEY